MTPQAKAQSAANIIRDSFFQAVLDELRADVLRDFANSKPGHDGSADRDRLHAELLAIDNFKTRLERYVKNNPKGKTDGQDR